jgi:hypothetical protein
MAKLSLIDLVQDILSDMNDDEVNSISDTVESLQVAQIVKSTYFEMIGRKDWPHLKTLMPLIGSSTSEKPTHMKVPEDVSELSFVQYNKRESSTAKDEYVTIKYVTPEEFLLTTSRYDSTNSDVKSVTDYSGVELHVLTDEHPSMYTSFDDEYLVFNSHKSDLDNTLQASSSRAQGYRIPSWTMNDDFVPDLPEEAFPALLAEAKSTCFTRLKQMADGKAEQQSRRQMAKLNRNSWVVNGGIRLPSYGRRGRK